MGPSLRFGHVMLEDMALEFRDVAHGSPDYGSTVDLRRRVLRIPLGLDFTQEQLAAEAGDTHLALFEDGRAAACLILTDAGGGDVKMRQVAVDPDRQRGGLGRWLVAVSEDRARAAGKTRMVLHARQTAVPFYEALGYAVEGEPFEEVGIPHRKMTKSL